MNPQLLRQFLVSLPSKFQFENTEFIQQNLYKALYYAITNEGEFIKELFPKISDIEIMDLNDYNIQIDLFDTPNFFSQSNSNVYYHPKGTACSRSLKKGEPVYRCEECGFDATCVLCVHCFNENDHIGHNTQVYIANDDTNGICDCGDTEAFVDSLNCKCQIIEHEPSDISHDFKQSIRSTITVLLEYILDVTNFSISPLPFIHEHINKGHSILTSEALSDYSSLPQSKYGVVDENSPNWALILWNDEYHTFPEATDAISNSIGVSQIRAHEIANDINSNGRYLMKTGDSPLSLYKALDVIESSGLVPSIISARDYFREEIIHHIFEWFKKLLDSDHTSFRDYFRLALGEILLEPNYKFEKSLPNALIEGLSIDIERRCFENSLLYGGKLVNGGLVRTKSDFTPKDLFKSSHLVLQPDNEPFFNSKLQFLLVFSIRYKKILRQLLNEVIMPPLLTDANLKAIFCKHYIQVYPQLITSLALVDREELLSCVGEISTQLIICPTSVQYILESGKIGNLIGPLAQLIEEHSGKWNYDYGYPNFHEPPVNDGASYRRIYEATTRCLHDINYMVDSSLADNSSRVLLQESNLSLILLLLRNFQGYWTIERKYGDHVEHEVLDFVIHLRYSIRVLKFAKQVAEFSNNDIKLVQQGCKLIMDFLFLRKINQKAPGIAEFTVSKDPVSFVHPINSLLSYLIQNYNFNVFKDVLKSYNEPFMKISDVSLRSIVLGNQVKIGFWIRNGLSVSRQATLYINSVMADSAYWRDIHLNQIALLIDDPKSTLYNFLDRWELLGWFSGDSTYSETIYEDKFPAISEKFILFIYNLLVDRTSFIESTKEQRLSNIGKKLISYSLSEGPKTYSGVKDELDPEISGDSNFDNWLIEVAEYQPPSNLIDSGLYRLKPHIYGQLDPFSLHLDSSQSLDVSESVVKYLSKVNKVPENEVNLKPKIIFSGNDYIDKTIGEFTRTTFFAKLIYKFLQVAIDTKDETFLPHLLQLIHGLILDNENVKGSETIPEAFVTIPVGDLLLNIVESTMSKNLVNKANFLLNSFIEADERVIDSLTDCFGKEHIEEFMKRRASNFESEKEKRKRIASERNARVLKKFAQQRKKFLNKNSDLKVEDKQPTDQKLRNCVVCGEPENNEEIFGILGNAANSSILWKVNQDDPHSFKSAFANYNESITSDLIFGKGYKYRSKPTWFDNLKYEAFVGSTCSHGMHYECYRRSCGRANHFACPLCQRFQNIFIPSYLPPTSGGGLNVSQLDYDPINGKYNTISHSSNELKSRTLIDSLFHEKLTESSMIQLRRRLEVFADCFNTKLKRGKFLEGESKPIAYFNLLCKLSTWIADTIKMHEITSRIEGNEGYTNFLNIPGSAKTFLKSLIQCRTILFELREMPSLLGSSNNLSVEIENFWESNYLVDNVFNEIIMLFFQTDESFKTLVRLGFSKIVTLCFYSITIRSKDGALDSLNLLDKPLDDTILENLHKFFEHGQQQNYIDFFVKGDKKPFFTSIYYAVEKCILPFLRQSLIFKDILTSSNDGDYEHRLIPELEQLSSSIKGQDRLENSDILCKALGIPTLGELLQGLTSGELEFEHKIHDIVLNAKIPKYLDSGILTLDYPGVIKLIDLPKDYMSCFKDQTETVGVYDNYLCLVCGRKLPGGKYYRHMRKCSPHTGVFFHPAKNTFRLVTHIGRPVSLIMSGPYLTVHGEVAEPRNNGKNSKATLSDLRYHDLNKQWLNLGLVGFITRHIQGSMQNNGANMTTFDFTIPDNYDGSSSEEEETDYTPFAW